MNFDIIGPYFFPVGRIIKIKDAVQLKEAVKSSPAGALLSSAPGCYVFGVKASGSKRIVPWYVGKAERQAVLDEATNLPHLQIYNEIFDEYENGRPALFFLPSTTPKGRPTKLAESEGKKPAVEFLENWLIATSLKNNPDLWNKKKTKMLRDLYVRGIFNPAQGDINKPATEFKKTLGIL